MDARYVISLALNAHLPFVRNFHSGDDPFQSGGAGLPAGSAEEGWFFEALSETYLPLLEVFDRLENDHIPFRLGICLSPLLCQMLGDELLLKKYLAYSYRQIEFGRMEVERTASHPELQKLAKLYYDRAVDQRISFTERYEGNILKAFDHYQRKGKIEILGTSASHAFLPFLCPFPEAIQAQMEAAISYYRQRFAWRPQGFWLPELGWSGDLDPYLRSYNFSYTIVDAHGFIFGKPAPRRGSFYPVKTPEGVFILSRDFYAARDIDRMSGEGVYRDNNRDVGYELSPEEVGPFLTADGERRQTGFKYWRAAARHEQNAVYDPSAASDKALEHARAFLETRFARFTEAAKHMKETPLSLCACNADSFGRFWHEGPQFIEALFRLGAEYREIQFMTPAEYLFKQNISAFEISMPEFSSWGFNGYAETWLDASNDWMYRHLVRSINRMVELAERFPNDSGLKERTLNQAAREILLAQTSDWSKLLYKQDSTEYARNQIESALRNFTTIYEALGSNYISTEWLTNLERRHNVFPNINYRVFRRKK
ncbi:glycoside hydrolase family protein [Spirochaetia bacterium]|nr:glycoside hydrolase family protein [Spirochaetia bacterium]